jgi:mono/diheme cytochrome c family protein
MREWIRNNRKTSVAAGLFLVSGLAWASPWDIDMINGVSSKAYEWRMPPAIPAGSVQRDGAVAVPGAVQRSSKPGGFQGDYVATHDRVTDGDALVNPYPSDDAAVDMGKRHFQVSCAPCHGVEGTGGGPVTHNVPSDDPEKAIRRFPIPAPLLSGTGSVTPMRSDGYLYLTIRNGGQGLGAGMPAYGISLTDQERWSIVSYMRTLEGNAYNKGPAAGSATPTAAPADGAAAAPTDGAAAPADGTGTPATNAPAPAAAPANAGGTAQ